MQQACCILWCGISPVWPGGCGICIKKKRAAERLSHAVKICVVCLLQLLWSSWCKQRVIKAIKCLPFQLMMGQHFASLREFFRMDGERQPTEICASAFSQALPSEMVNRDSTDGSPENEANGNVPVMNSNILPNRECKPEGNLDNDRLNLDLDNHNSRFESLYSQPVEAHDTKQVCNNGNVAGETTYRQQEACCSSSGGSNSSSSSEDSPVNPPLRRSSKTLSFGRRKSRYSDSAHWTVVCNKFR